MITKGIIQSINYLDNTCTLRIPTFETAGNKINYVLESTITIAPGIYNGYKVNDVVLVGFGPTGFDEPIILGKLYLGVAQEKASGGGSIACTDLVVNNTASLPATTTINFGNIFEDTTKASVAEMSEFKKYKSFKDVFSAVASNSKNIANLLSDRLVLSTNATYVGKWIDGKNLYQQVLTITTDTTPITTPNIETIWIDTGKSFIQTADGITQLGTYSITKSNNNFIINLSSMTNKTAYVTIYYTLMY